MKKSVSIVLPTYNERRNIQILIPRIEKEFQSVKHEILVVDDSSPDGTSDVVKKLMKNNKNLRLIVRKKKEGIGAALREGYNKSKNEIIISSDADLSFGIKDMTRLYQQINKGYDLVVGSRHLVKNSYEMSKPNIIVKGMISRFGNKINTILSGVRIHDFTANFRAIRKEVWNKIQTKDNTNFLLAEMILMTHLQKYKVTEIPVVFKDRLYGKSKLNLTKEIFKFMRKMVVFSIKYRLIQNQTKRILR